MFGVVREFVRGFIAVREWEKDFSEGERVEIFGSWLRIGFRSKATRDRRERRLSLFLRESLNNWEELVGDEGVWRVSR